MIFWKFLNKSRSGESLASYPDMVDQSHFSVKTSRGKNCWLGDTSDRLQRLGVDELEIVDRKILRGISEQVGAGRIEVDRGILFSGDCEVPGGHEGAANTRGVLTLLSCQPGIPGGEGKAALFSNSGMADDFDRDIQVADHSSDQGKLLEVLVSENGKVRLDHVEELEDNRQDTIEVSRAARPAKVPGEQGLGEEDRVIGMVKSLFFRSKGDVDTFGFAELKILFEGLRVVGEVADAVELDRIDEDRDDHGAGGADQLTGFAEERKMPLMEGSHGRDNRKRAGVFPDQVLYGIDVRYRFNHYASVVRDSQYSMKIISRFLFLMAAFSLPVSSVAYGQKERESFEVTGIDVQRGFREFYAPPATELEVNEKRMARPTSENAGIDQDMTTTRRGLSGEIRKFIEAYSAKDGYDLVIEASAHSTILDPRREGGR